MKHRNQEIEELVEDNVRGSEERDIVYPSSTEFRVTVTNICPYPVRVLLFMDELTHLCTYSVFKQFERRELMINLSTYGHLQKDPKIRMTKIDG